MTTHELEHEAFEQFIESKRKIAVGYGWNYTNFKRFIGQFLKRKNSEDCWVFDYESFLIDLHKTIYEHPVHWANEYYGEDWNNEKANRSLNSLKTITNNKPVTP